MSALARVAVVALITLAACTDVREFDGAPLRVYLSLVAAVDGGDVLAVIALYDDGRVEVRLIRGGAQPVYAIFDLRR